MASPAFVVQCGEIFNRSRYSLASLSCRGCFTYARSLLIRPVRLESRGGIQFWLAGWRVGTACNGAMRSACSLFSKVQGLELQTSFGELASTSATNMTRVACHVLLALALLVGAQCSTDVRLVDAAGGLSNVGLLQVRTDAGFGTVCGASAAAADVIAPCSLACAACFLALITADVLKLFTLSLSDVGQGDLQIDGLCSRLCQQLPLWFLWWCRLVRCSGLPSGGLASHCTFNSSSLQLPAFARPWRI
jgi:hypothetical protein